MTNVGAFCVCVGSACTAVVCVGWLARALDLFRRV